MHSFSSYLKSLQLRYWAILASMFVIIFGLIWARVVGYEDYLDVDNQEFIKLVFDEERGYDRVYKHSELSGYTTFRGVFIGVKGEFERNLLMKRQLRGTSAPRIEFIELDEPYLQKYEIFAREIADINAQFFDILKDARPLEKITKIDPNFLWLDTDKADIDNFEEIFNIWSERHQAEEFAISRDCRVTRYVENYEIIRTVIIGKNSDISKNETILCASVAIMLHYGFSNLNYMLSEMNLVLKSELTKRYLFKTETSKFFSKLYIRNNPDLLIKAGMSKDEVNDILRK